LSFGSAVTRLAFPDAEAENAVMARKAAEQASLDSKRVKEFERLNEGKLSRAAEREEAMKQSSDLDEEYNSVDNELNEQMDNFTRDQELAIPEADKELAVLQGIWDKYELDHENVSAEDIMKRLYAAENGTSSNGTSSNSTGGTWEEGADVGALLANATEPPEPEPAKVKELRREVKRLQAEVKRVTKQVKKADAIEPPALQLRRLALRRRAVEALSAALSDDGHRR